MPAKTKAKKVEAPKPQEEAKVITQLSLANYFVRHAKIEELQEAEKKDRELLISRSKMSWTTEDGPFFLSVKSFASSRTNTDRLYEEIAKLWGQAAVDNLKAVVVVSSSYERVSVDKKN